MVKQWIGNLTSKQIVIYLLIITVVGIFTLVATSCGGGERSDYDPNYKPPTSKGTVGDYGVKVAPAGSEKGNKYFDPSAKSPGTDGKLATKLDAKCEFDSQKMKVSCEAHRTSMQSILKWTENHGDQEFSGEKEGLFEFTISSPSDPEVLVILEECISTTCKLAETTVDVSGTVP